MAAGEAPPWLGSCLAPPGRPETSILVRPRRLALVVLIPCALWLCLGASRSGDGVRHHSFPVHVVPPGPLPALWVFLHAECPHCHRHLASLHGALARLPRQLRARAAARTHVVGDVAATDPLLQRHPRSLQASMGTGPVPCTWWVDADSSLAGVWRGPLDEKAWMALFSRLLQEATR
jgi:hypothetical protein